MLEYGLGLVGTTTTRGWVPGMGTIPVYDLIWGTPHTLLLSNLALIYNGTSVIISAGNDFYDI